MPPYQKKTGPREIRQSKYIFVVEDEESGEKRIFGFEDEVKLFLAEPLMKPIREKITKFIKENKTYNIYKILRADFKEFIDYGLVVSSIVGG